jgi:hypothetical protein
VAKNSDAFSYIEDVTSAIIDKMVGTISIPAKKFFSHVIPLFMGVRGRLNFLNLARHGHLSEKSYRHQFEQEFDFLEFNTRTIQTFGSGKYVAAFDPSFINKSGKHTPHLGMFWSGCEQRSKRGLEVGVLAAIDLEHETAFPLQVRQSLSSKELKASNSTTVNQYVQQILDASEAFKELGISYLTADAFFAKQNFISSIREGCGIHVITKARNDANFQYPYNGPQRIAGKRGRDKKYDGKVDVRNFDRRRIKKVHEDSERKISCGNLYAVQLKQMVKAVFIEEKRKGKLTGTYAILICTDTELDAMSVYKYYTLRFQIEFLIRDGKQFTGLEDCQARSEKKLEFHFNTSLTTVAVAKGAFHLALPDASERSFSMHDVKVLAFNQLFLKRIFSNSHFDLSSRKMRRVYREACEFGLRAA